MNSVSLCEKGTCINVKGPLANVIAIAIATVAVVAAISAISNALK